MRSSSWMTVMCRACASSGWYMCSEYAVMCEVFNAAGNQTNMPQVSMVTKVRSVQ